MSILAVHHPAERHGRFVTALIGVRAAEGFAMVHSEEELKMLSRQVRADVLEE
jgi:hypothetical protein